MWFAERSGFGLNDLLGRRCPAPAPIRRSPTPEREHYNNLRTLAQTRATEPDARKLYGLAAQVFVPVDSLKAYC